MEDVFKLRGVFPMNEVEVRRWKIYVKCGKDTEQIMC
jgi:hypothetical protein